MAVTTVSDSLILGGWVAKVLKNGDKNYGSGRVGDNKILTFPLYSIKNAIFLFILTCVCIFIKLRKLHFGQFFSFRISKVL